MKQSISYVTWWVSKQTSKTLENWKYTEYVIWIQCNQLSTQKKKGKGKISKYLEIKQQTSKQFVGWNRNFKGKEKNKIELNKIKSVIY